MGLAALYTGLILWRLFVRLDSLRYPIRTYGDLAHRLLGPGARAGVTALQSLQLIVNVSICVSESLGARADPTSFHF